MVTLAADMAPIRSIMVCTMLPQMAKSVVIMVQRVAHGHLCRREPDKMPDGVLRALDFPKRRRALEYAHRKEQHQQRIAHGFQTAVDPDNYIPDEAALEVLRRCPSPASRFPLTSHSMSPARFVSCRQSSYHSNFHLQTREMRLKLRRISIRGSGVLSAPLPV